MGMSGPSDGPIDLLTAAYHPATLHLAGVERKLIDWRQSTSAKWIMERTNVSGAANDRIKFGRYCAWVKDESLRPGVTLHSGDLLFGLACSSPTVACSPTLSAVRLPTCWRRLDLQRKMAVNRTNVIDVILHKADRADKRHGPLLGSKLYLNSQFEYVFPQWWPKVCVHSRAENLAWLMGKRG
ncbi:hypothetical protein B0H19DRAFT_1235882 [Mycena capillaripes]|nr:hypothetical protein B0H19DRAFT_1235882 [Mycena capillaripes]